MSDFTYSTILAVSVDLAGQEETKSIAISNIIFLMIPTNTDFFMHVRIEPVLRFSTTECVCAPSRMA